MPTKNVDIGEALYMISQNLMERSSPDLLQKFIGPHTDAHGNKMPDDGIMCTTGGYYRIAEDIETKNRVALFSFSYDKLRGLTRDNGDICLTTTDGVYPIAYQKVPSFGAARGGVLRSQISEHHYNLQRGFKEELNLYGADLTGLFNAVADPDVKDPVVMKFGNTRLSYGIYETKAGAWELRRRIREKQPDEVATEAIMGLDKAGSGKMIDKILSDGESLGIFQSKEEAMAKMVLDFNIRSERSWNAKSLLSASEIAHAPITSAKRGVVGQVVGFVKNRSLGELLFVGGIAAITLPFGGKVKAAQLGAAAIGVASVYANKFGEHIFVNGFSLTEKLKFWKNKEAAATKEAAKPAEEKRKALDDYLENVDNNKKRWCPRMATGIAQNLRLLNSEEADLKPEDAVFTSPVRNDGQDIASHWAEKDIPNVQNHAFKAIATPLDTKTMSYYYLMGAVAITHTHDDKSRSVYIMARPNMKVSDKSFIRSEIEPMIKNGNVLHVYQEHGGETRQEVLSVEKMISEVKGLLVHEEGADRRTVSALRHVKWLFGRHDVPQTPEDIHNDLLDMYESTAGGETKLGGLMSVSYPKTLNGSPTIEQMDKFSEAKGKARADFMKHKNLMRGLSGATYPHFKPILQEMGLVAN